MEPDKTLIQIQRAMEELGAAVTGLQVRHRGRTILLHPCNDPRGAWATLAFVDDEDEDGDIALGYGPTPNQALDDAADKADALES